MKRTLNDRLLRGLKPAKPGGRYEVMDSLVPGFGVRITDKGQRSFILVSRYGGRHPVRRKLGACGALALDRAREKARRWIELIQQGIDPAEEARTQKLAEMRKRENSFASVAEDFIRDKLPTERKGREVEQNIRSEFIGALGALPITEITEDDVLSIIRTKARTAPDQARNLLGIAKRFFSWAVDQRVYGLKRSPCAELKPARIIGKKRRRGRILDDDELFAFWRAAKRMPYPCGPVYRLLVLTALRLNEPADGSWPEFHPKVARELRGDAEEVEWSGFDDRELAWTIPASRMKGKNSEAHEHVVPLTREALDLLHGLPRLPGKFIFSTTAGEKPAWMSSKVKKRLDARMLMTLRAMARWRGDDPAAVELQRWTNHDLRRTVRSGLSRLRVPEEVREAVLAHVRPGIKGTYDRYDYFDEKLDALQLWTARLLSIVEPAGGAGGRRNVIALSQVRR